MHRCRALWNAPSSGFATFAPTKSVGEKALDSKEALKGVKKIRVPAFLTRLVHLLAALFLLWKCIPIERLLPPRFLRGEKVAEGRYKGGVDTPSDQPRLVRTA